MDDQLNKELEKNQKYSDLLYKQLEIDKKIFIDKIKSDLGKTIVQDLKEVKEKSKEKKSLWSKILKIFK